MEVKEREEKPVVEEKKKTTKKSTSKSQTTKKTTTKATATKSVASKTKSTTAKSKTKQTPTKKSETKTNATKKVATTKTPEKKTTTKKATTKTNTSKTRNVSETKKIDDHNFTPLETPGKRKTSGVMSLFGALLVAFLIIVFIALCTFTILNINNPNIIGGVSIKGIDVSNLSKEEAKEKINSYIQNSIPEEISLKHGDFETSISTNGLEIYFDTDKAVDVAYSIGRNKNIFENNFMIFRSFLTHVDVNPGFSMDEEHLKNVLKDVSGKLPDKIIESGYYIDDNNLVITKGSEGAVVDVDSSSKYIKDNINRLNMKNVSLELITKTATPKPVDLESIYKEIHKDPVDAHFTQNPYSFFPSENGLDFACSMDEAKALLQQQAQEYIVPLKVIYPNVTTNMIGTEAFPDLLADFSTRYPASNRNRTTNLILAANKINGTVLMPGEVFSYNKVVGERTIAAGYKEAAIYVQGRVEDGLGGGICQIATTLYNSVLFANLEIVERSNHQFVPSYVGASRDATVVYGAIDFKFKNNRDYPVKITCSVAGGIANFKIYGLRKLTDYDVQISARTTGSSSNYIYSEAYKSLYQNGALISSQVISKDVYKRH